MRACFVQDSISTSFDIITINKRLISGMTYIYTYCKPGILSDQPSVTLPLENGGGRGSNTNPSLQPEVDDIHWSEFRDISISRLTLKY